MNEIFKLIAESGRTDLMEEWYKIEKKLELLDVFKTNFKIKVESGYLHRLNGKILINHYIVICDSNNNYVVSRLISSAMADKVSEWLDGFTHITIE